MLNISKTQTSFIIGGVLLLIIFLAVFFGMSVRQEKLILGALHSSAELMFENIALTRRWNANYGGVYVWKRPGLESNPYLKDPDIKSDDGKVYTKKNPALMTREISEYATKAGKFEYHITSRNLVNPANKADEWEEKALLSFEQGTPEATQITSIKGKEVYRLMRPLKFEQGCRNCHLYEDNGTEKIRGGISVTLPFEETRVLLSGNRINMIATGTGVILIFAFVLYFFVWRLMNSLEVKNKKLVKFNELKNKFIGMASHDLRNPVSSIKGFSDILLSEDEDIGSLGNEQKRLVNTINRISNDSLKLLNDLLDITVMESGKLRINIKEQSINDLVKERIEINRVIAAKKDITIRENLDSMPNALFDRDRISQVIDNFISNAVKFSPLGSNIYISLTKEGKNALIKVKDEGPGISEENQTKLFGEFQKIGTKTTGGEKSTGLGLSIVKKIVNAHKGTIKVSSVLGSGSEFMFTVPLAETISVETQKVLKVLIVDNLKEDHTIIKRCLKDLSYRTHSAINGKSAVDMVKIENYDVILMDIKMPVMDGYTAIKEIRRWEQETGKKKTPIIVLTSIAFIDDHQKSFEAGCNDHLTKPIDKEMLINKILEHTSAVSILEKTVNEVDNTKKKSLNVLYVEDDQDIRALISSYFKHTLHKIDMAEDGKAAYDKFITGNYDIVLMDVEMPIMDGYTAVKNIRKWESDNGVNPTPIIMLTAHEVNELDKQIEAQCNGFISKPIKKSVLLETIETYASHK